MNTQTSAAFASWLLLSPDERNAFEHAQTRLTPPQSCREAETAVQPAATPVAAVPAMPFAGREPYQLSLLPLPASASQGRSRLSPPPVDTALFVSEAYRAVAGRGGTALAYIAGCAGLARIYQEINAPLFKGGSTSALAIATRMRDLNEAGYAAYRRAGAGAVVEPGFDSWNAVALPLQGPRSPNSPVTGLGNALRVLLPAGMTHEDFDIALTERLRSVSLTTIAAKPAFRLMCAGRGFEIDRLERFTLKWDGVTLKSACELVRVSPRWEADAYADLIEGIIGDFVLARCRAGDRLANSGQAVER